MWSAEMFKMPFSTNSVEPDQTATDLVTHCCPFTHISQIMLTKYAADDFYWMTDSDDFCGCFKS